MSEKKSWRDYSKNYSGDKATDSSAEEEKTGSWRDYSSLLNKTTSNGTSDTSSGDWRSYSKVDPTAIVGKNVVNRVNTWLQNHNNYIKDYQTRYADRKFSYEDSYVSDSRDWLDTVNKQRLNFQAEADELISYLDQHKGYLDPEWMKQVKKTLTDSLEQQKSIASAASGDYDYWSKFTPNRERQAEGYTAEKLYNEWQAGQKQYAEDMSFDVEAGMLELEKLKKEREGYLAKQSEERVQEESDETFWESLGRWLGNTPDTTIPLAGASGMSGGSGITNPYDKQISELEKRIERSKYIQGYEGYMGNMDSKDYAPNSQYVSTRTDVAMDDARWGLYKNQYDESKLFGDFLHDYINRNPDALDVAKVNNTATDAYFLGLDQGFLQTLKDEEIGVYNYLYNTQGKESANEYLSFLESDLQGRRRAQEQAFWAGYAKESPVASSAFSIMISPLKSLSAISQIADYAADGTVDQNAAYNKFSHIPTAIREQVASDIVENSNNKKWGKVGSWTYQLGMSMGDFLVNSAVSGGNSAMSLALMGSGAMADTVISAKDRGLNDDQAMILGVVAGAAEIVTEKFSLDALFKGDLSKGALKYILTNAFTEGTEEVSSSVINLVTDVLVSKEKSEWQMQIQEYLRKNPGATEQEAFNKVLGDTMLSLGLDFLGGALMGGAMGAGGAAINYVTNARPGLQQNIDAVNEYGDKTGELIQEGLESDVNSKSYELAQQYQKQTQGTEKKAGKLLTGYQIRQLLAANQDQINPKDMKLIQQAAENRLTELGQTEDVSKVAELAARYATGQKLSKAEKSFLANSKYGSRVYNELLPKNILSGDFTSEWAENIGTREVNFEAYNKEKIKMAREAFAEMVRKATEDPNAYKPLESRVEAESQVQVSDTGKSVIHGTEQEIDLSKPHFKEITEDRVVLYADGKAVDANNIDYADADLGYAIKAVGKIEHMTPEYAGAMVGLVDKAQPVVAQMNGLDEAFTYGFNNYSEADLKAGLFTGNLTPVQLNDAYKLGQQVRSKTDMDADAPVVKMRTAAEAKLSEEQKLAKQKAEIENDDVEVYFENGSEIVKFDEHTGKYDKKRMAAVNTAKFLAKLKIGGKYYFFESYLSKTLKDDDGNALRVYKDANGKEVAAPNGIYMANDGSIHIDLNAGDDGSGIALFTLGHELTHFVKDQSKKQFKILSDLVKEAFDKTDLSMHKRVLAKQKFLEDARREKALKGESYKKVSYEEAYEEVVADAMSTMLTDGTFHEKLMEIKVKDKGLFNTIKRFFNKMIAKFRKEYEKLTPDQKDAQDIRAMKDMFDKIQTAFAEALVEASDNFHATEGQKNTTKDGGVKNEIREIGNTGRFYVQADRQVLTGDDPELWGKQIENYINERIRNEKDVAIPTADGHILLLTGRSAYKLKDNHIASVQKKVEAILTDEDYALKGRMATHIDELIQVARFDGYESDLDNKHENDIGEDGFNYFEAYFRDFDTKYYRVVFSAALNEQEETVYSIGRIRQRSFPADRGSSSKKEALKNGRKASGGIIYTSEAKSQEVKTALQLAYEKALKQKGDNAEASEETSATDEVGMEFDADTESVAPKVMNSERTWTSSDYVQERNKAAKEIAKAIGVTEQKAKDYIDSVNSIAKMIAEDRSRLDYFSSPGRSSFVDNAEYGGSFDFSTLCKKRRLLTGTFTAIQKALPNTALTADEILDIRNRMKEADLEVSCGLCYVEGSRANMGQFSKEFLRLYKQYYPDAWQPNMVDVNTPDGVEWMRINHPEAYEQYEYFWNHYGTLKEGDKNLFASQQKPKLYQLHTEYNGEILTKFKGDEKVEEKNLNGGIRLQSFSDFEIVHLIDTMQIIMDMSRVGLAGQAYTKVPDFAWALGDTGLKINLSLIAKGVDENGNLIFDDVEGMPIAEAMKLRDRYSKNVGTILVAFNDEQLLAAMADDRVDFIIPFHRSQWKKSQYEAMGLPAKTKDYTFMQNEKYIKPQFHEYRGRMVKDKATNYMPNEYWDFSKSGKENAEAYLEMCARNNKRPKFYKLLANNGDGSYSLKTDGSTDGYWKLLIDFKMYDNDGNGSPQMSVKPEFNMEEASRMLNDYKGGHSQFPVAQGIVDGFVKDYKNSHKGQKFSERGAKKSERNNAPTFYSQMGKVVDGMKQEKFGASSVISMLRGRGVKAEEIRWSGIQAFLDGKKSVTKAELLDFINNSMLQIEEETRSKNDTRTEFVQAWRSFVDQDLDESEILAGLDNLDEMESYLESLVEDGDLDRYYADYILDVAKKVNNKDLPAKWDQYKLDGGENYRELIFKMPGATYTNKAMQAHWGDDTQGVLAHARMQDFNVDGKKMLFIEEIQSDWHNAGHKYGYGAGMTESEKDAERAKIREDFMSSDVGKSIIKKVEQQRASDSLQQPFKDVNEVYDWIAFQPLNIGTDLMIEYPHWATNERLNALMALDEKISKLNGVFAPDAPFHDNYHEFVLKRILRMAAEEGYDSIGWTTADIQSERWSDDYAEGNRIEYDQDIPKFLKKYGKQWGAEVGKTNIDTRGVTDWEKDMLAKGIIELVPYESEVWTMDITDAMKKSVLTEGQAMYSERGEGSSNRSLLANAFEGITQNSVEYKMLQDYKDHIKELNKLDARLSDLNAEIRKIRFGTEGARDMARLTELENEAKEVAKEINRYDKRLLSLEASEPLRKVIDRERKKENQKVREHVQEIQQNKKMRAEQTELRHKIRKTVRDLNKILNRGNKKQNVKEDMKGFASKALELADYLFTDHISNDDLIRNGITVRMTPKEAALVKETEEILSKLYDQADSLTDEEFKRLDEKRKDNEYKLRDLLTAQRNERLNTPVYNLFNDLVTEYAKLKNSGQEAVKAAYNADVERFLRSYIGEANGETDSDRKMLLQNMRVADMTTDELWKLSNAYEMVLHSIRQANNLFVKGKSETLEQKVGRIAKDFESRKIPEGKVATIARNLSNKMGWDYEKLYYALDRIGSEAFTELVMNIADAENTVMQDVIEAAAFRDEMVKKYDYNNWKVNKEIDREFLDSTGKKFKLTLGQLMALYAYSRRDGAWDHIEYGGFVFGEAALTNPRPADSYKLTKEQCKAITDLLTKEQKGYAEDMQKFLSETMGEKGNEVSMLLYGIKMFGEKNYFPIHIAGQFKAQANESQAKAAAGFSSMTNAGFTHAQNPNAKAPFVLEGFNEIWVDHVNEMSRYHGTVPALEDMRRVMNYSHYSEASAESMAIKQLMENSFGKEAVDYFDNLYREANSGAITDKLQKWPKKLLSLFRKNSVAYSLSVLVQQPASVVRAYAMIDRKYFGVKGVGVITSGVAKAIGNKWTKAHTNAYNEMLKYAPGVTMAKEIGGFDTATGGSIRSYLLDTNKSLKQTVKTGNAKEVIGGLANVVDDNTIANLPNVADKIAWIEIWTACKRETVAKHKDLATNSEEFLKIVGERFTEVIRATQVYDSIFSKSPMLKSKHLAVQYLVSFMNEPNTVANMVEKAVRDAAKGNWKSGARTAAVVIHSIIFTNVLKSMIYAMRDDDEDETYIEKYLESITGGLIGDFNPLGYIPMVRDAWSIWQGYDVERPDMAIVQDAISAIDAAIKNKNKDTDEMTEEQLIAFDKKVTEANWKVVESMTAFFGIPVKNIRREVNGVINTIKNTAQNSGLTTSSSVWDKVSEAVDRAIPFVKFDKNKQDKLYEAILSGDTAYVDRLKATYKDEDAYHSAVRKLLRENDPRIREAAQARYDGNIAKTKQLYQEIKREGKFDPNDILEAINSEEAAIKKDTEPKSESSEYSATDFVDAILLGDANTAKAMRDSIIQFKVKGGKTQEEAEAIFAESVRDATKNAFNDDLLDAAGAKNMLLEYADMDEEEAAAKVSYWAFKKDNPKYDISQTNYEKYQEFAEPAEIPLDVFEQYVKGTAGIETIYDEWGDVELSKRDQVLAVIDSLDLTWQQKDALYLAHEYAESQIWDVPW